MPSSRSRLANSLLPRGIDGRTADARRLRDLAVALADDLGGEGSLTEAERIMVRQAAAAIVASEAMQAKALAGAPVDSHALAALSTAASRQLAELTNLRKGKK